LTSLQEAKGLKGGEGISRVDVRKRSDFRGGRTLPENSGGPKTNTEREVIAGSAGVLDPIKERAEEYVHGEEV